MGGNAVYSKDIEPVCGLCVFSKEAKGVAAYCVCTKRNEYVLASRTGCEIYKYDIFKRKTARKKNTFGSGFSPEDFVL